MVDELSRPFRAPHIGWQLWSAAQRWKTLFADAMVESGHNWYREARSSVIPYIGRDGTRQSVIAREMGLTRQAIQQLVDDLEQQGIVERRPDPNDRRAKIVCFTAKGLLAVLDAEQIKQSLESRLRQDLGDADFRRLSILLERSFQDK